LFRVFQQEDGRVVVVKRIFTIFTFKTRDVYLRLKRGISSKKRRDWRKQGGDTSMDVLTAINRRRSVRAYKPAEVEEEKLRKILEAARLSPSASNRQDWKFIVVRNMEARKKLAKAAFGQSFIGEAPVVIAACGTEPKAIMACGQPAYTVDVSIACAFMILQAYELGLGTCWIGAFKEDEVKKILKIPEPIRVVAVIPLGYPDEDPSQRSRKDLDEIICFEKFE
jgi:nitroreductase